MAEDCTTCAYANWRRTEAGRLHPSGDGRCSWTFPEIALPKAFYWTGFGMTAPRPSGGHINRKQPHPDCPQFASEELRRTERKAA